MTRSVWIVAVLLVVLAIGCPGPGTDDGTDDGDGVGTPQPGDVIEAEPFDSTKMLGDAELAGLEAETGDGRLVFPVAPPSLANVARGNIIVAGKSPSTPHGLLRVVQSAHRNGAALTLTTVHAPIQLAFRRLHLDLAPRSTGDLATIFQGSAAPARRLEAKASGPQEELLSALSDQITSQTVEQEVVLFDGDGDEETENDRAVLKVKLGGTIDYGLRLDFDWGAIEDLPGTVTDCILEALDALVGGDPPDCSIDNLLPEAKATFDVTAHLVASADMEGAAKADFEKEFPIFPPAAIAEIVVGPVVIAPVLEITGRVEGGASARFAVGVEVDGDLSTGVDISSKNLGQPTLRLPDITRVDFTPHEPTVTLRAHARAGVGASITATLFNVAGPYAELGIFAALDANTDNTPCWTAHSGIQSQIGLRVIPTVPLLGAVTLFDWESAPFEALNLELASGPCLPDPDVSTLPPGAGPDATRYANPTFTPWARTVAPPVTVTPPLLPNLDDTHWIELHPTIDGRYVVAGSHADTLFKLDEAGVVTWARQYRTEGQGDPFPAQILRVTNTADAGLVLLTRMAGDYRLGLLKVDQTGEPIFHVGFAVSEECYADAQTLAPDGGGGFFVAGSCVGSVTGWLMHFDAGGNVVGATSFTDPEGNNFFPTVLVAVGGEAVVAGSTAPGGGLAGPMFAARLNAAGALRFARWYSANNGLLDIAPSAGIAATNGDVTLAGSANGHSRGFLARLKQDGTVGWQSFPTLPPSLTRAFALSSIAELPTTGYVVAGSVRDYGASGVEGAAGLIVAGLDAVGGVLWSRHYTLLAGADQSLDTGFPEVRLTDDGGALVTGLAQAQRDDVRGQVWAMKVFAKNGAVEFEPDRATSADPGLHDVAYDLQVQAWNVTLGSAAYQTAPLVTTSRQVSLTTEKVSRD